MKYWIPDVIYLRSSWDPARLGKYLPHKETQDLKASTHTIEYHWNSASSNLLGQTPWHFHNAPVASDNSLYEWCWQYNILQCLIFCKRKITSTNSLMLVSKMVTAYNRIKKCYLIQWVCQTDFLADMEICKQKTNKIFSSVFKCVFLLSSYQKKDWNIKEKGATTSHSIKWMAMGWMTGLLFPVGASKFLFTITMPRLVLRTICSSIQELFPGGKVTRVWHWVITS
jgi:hypothetical protein